MKVRPRTIESTHGRLRLAEQFHDPVEVVFLIDLKIVFVVNRRLAFTAVSKLFVLLPQLIEEDYE